MSSTVAETPTTPTPASFHPSTPTAAAAAAAAAAEQQSATPKPTHNSPSTSPAASDLRHVTSHTKFTPQTTSKTGKLAPHSDAQRTLSGLSPNHIPAALNLSPARLGSRSSSSIPSSPTSVHSSSSAIFERDIEPIPTLSFAAPSPTHAANPHRIPRSKATEAIEISVPSVLDSAITALNDDPLSVTVLSSAPLHPCSPGPLPSAGSGNSSGSPPVMSLLLQGMGVSGLASASASVSGAASVSGLTSGFASPIASSRAPSPARSISPIGDVSASSPKSIAITTATHVPTTGAPASPVKKTSMSGPANPSPQAVKSTNRLSFISYTDLLNSAPITTQPLSAVLAPGSIEPPTHVVVVNDEDSLSTRGRTGYSGSQMGDARSDREGEKDVDSLGVVGLGGGEWEREKMGWGLEERLERLWAAEKEVREATLRAPKGERERSLTSRSLGAAAAAVAATAAVSAAAAA